MTLKQVQTLKTLDIIGNILATIEILITLLIIKYGPDNDIKSLFVFVSIICFIIIIKSIFKKDN